ncbi:MAG TPA: cytochrome b N-terminal domain-containing protein [Tepidisphaeraceae bacterium]|nr:cytochrome b N-terminal domain-containing protein [Tepidisphaeraceae bacterium]
MIKGLLDWLDDRTGYRGIIDAALFEHIPGGARWRYVWGSTLVFAFSVQMITGFFLWLGYSPSSQTAWESVYYIQYQMAGGWLLRGIHHFMAQAMIVLLSLHMAQVIIDGAYRAPREVNFWIGLILLHLVLGLSLTGYLLPWDQKGYWATQVATNIMGIAPVIGPYVQRIVIGGPDYGHLTLTRFFAVHAGLLPLLIIIFTAAHIYVFRRHGIKHKEPLVGPDSTFWVDQVLKDAIACLVVLAVVLFLVIWPWIISMGAEHPGADLGAPADSASPYSAARPEWYFLFLFQFLKLKQFAGANEVYGAIVIPMGVMLLFALMPIVGRWNLGHRFNIAFFGAFVIGVIILTGMAIMEDRTKTDYQAAVKLAQFESRRAIELAQAPAGIPATGAITLIRTDPAIQGPRLFAQNCASCHRYDGHDGTGQIPGKDTDPQTASDLKGFGSREWLGGLLDPRQIDSPHYFGTTKFKEGKMVKFIKEEMAAADEAKKSRMKSVVAALSAEAGLKSQKVADATDTELIEQGQVAIRTAAGCADCHTFHEIAGDTEIPDLTGYGSRKWLVDFISNPSHERFYGTRNDRMPAFGAKQLLDETQIGLIIDWLRGDWYTPQP